MAWLFCPKQLFPWPRLSISNILMKAATRKIQSLHQPPSTHASPCPGPVDPMPTPTRPDSFKISCPICSHIIEARMRRLYSSINKPCIMHCKACHKSSSARKWHCMCSRPWIACPLHRSEGFACKPKPTQHVQCQETHSAHAHNKRPRLADSIRQLGPDTGMNSNSSSSRPTCTHATLANHAKRSVSVSAPNPPLKRRELVFTPGPKITRRIMNFEEAAV